MPKPKLFVSLVVLVLAATLVTSQAEPWVKSFPYGPPVQLLNDTAFNNGFRAFMSCKQQSFEGFSAGLGFTGNCTEYNTPYVNLTHGRNYAVRTWPDTGAPNDVNKFWNFNEGAHSGFSISPYYFPSDTPPYLPGPYDLRVNMLEANQENNNGVLIASSSNLIWLQSMNNLVWNPNYGALMKTVSSDRHGFLMMYMNTATDIRNNPSTYSGTDTWPHFIVEQNFKEVVDLATLHSVRISANVAIPFVHTLPGYSNPNANYSIGVSLRRKDNPASVLFLGYNLYSAIGENQRLIGDQWGSPAYSGDNADVGGYIVPGAPARLISFDLRELMDKAIAYGNGALGPYTLDDYYLAGVGLGWETFGYHEVKSEISNVSVVGDPRALFDAEVYEQPPNQLSIYNQWNNGLGWSEGQMRAHWWKYGCWEGRVASTTFDVKIYMDRWGNPSDPGSSSTSNTMPQCYNGDGSRNYACAIVHYVWVGRDAGRLGRW